MTHSPLRFLFQRFIVEMLSEPKYRHNSLILNTKRPLQYSETYRLLIELLGCQLHLCFLIIKW